MRQSLPSSCSGLSSRSRRGSAAGRSSCTGTSKSKDLATYDGRETAPAAAKPDRFLKDGTPIKFETAVKSGLSIGTPGLVRLLEHTHKKHGKLPWAKLFEPAIKLADEGFKVSRRLSALLMWNGPKDFAPSARRYFFDERNLARGTGSVLKNPEYAATLRAIATKGADAFYSGPIAEAIVAAARTAPNFAGDLSLDDLANYKVVERKPLCVTYRTKKVCGMGPPSSGGVAVAQILKFVEAFDLGNAWRDSDRRGRDASNRRSGKARLCRPRPLSRRSRVRRRAGCGIAGPRLSRIRAAR